MKINKFLDRTGFTLVEVLVIVAILAIAGVVVSNIFFVSLRSSIKSQNISQLKQKGESALTVMERMIRGAEEIAPGGDLALFCTASQDSIAITYKDELTTFDCSPSQIASISANNSTILISNVIVDCTDFIRCTLSSGGRPIITIKFSLAKGEIGALPYRTKVDFETDIVPRNY